MACNWKYKNGEIVGVKGNPSIFKELEEKFGLEEAINLYTVSQSDAFQEIFGGRKEVKTAPQITQELIDHLKQTGLSEDVFLMSTQEIDAKLKELGVSDDVRKQVIAWHGSPHKFDRFSTDKMGTGEGVQAFGWGLYFTDLESIARNYADTLGGKPKILYQGKDINTIPEFGDIFYYLDPNNSGFIPYSKVSQVEKMLNLVEEMANSFLNSNYNRNDVYEQSYEEESKNVLKHIADIKKNISNLSIQEGRNLYKVSLHKGKTLDQYTWLEWDKPLSEKQHDIFKTVFQKGGYIIEGEDEFGYYLKSKRGLSVGYISKTGSGEFLYKKLANLLGSQKESSLSLLENNIDGIKYPAESISRGATSDTARGFNYVVFDENAITIEEQIQFQKALNRVGIDMIVNGFVYKNQVFLNKATASNETAVHEFSHLFNSWLKENRKELYNKGIDLVKKEVEKENSDIKDIIDYVRTTQPDLKGEAFLEEVLAETTGKRGSELLNSKKKSGIIDWLKEFWNEIKDMLGLLEATPEQISKMTLKEFADASAVQMLKAQDIVNFVTAENENKKPLTKEQKADFRNMLKDIPNFNKQSFIDSFYVDGLFIITDKLQPFYSRYEVQNLKNDVQLQAKVKNAVEALKNTEEEIEATVEQVEKINEINSFGKLTNYNPQKEIQEALAGIQDRDEFDEALNNLPFPNFLRTVNRDELFEKMSAMQRVEVYSELDGQIVPQPQEFVEPLLALKKEEIDFELVDNIDFLLESPQDVLENTQEATAKILEEIVEQGANSAIDLQGLTLDKPFLEELRMFILGENPNFVEVYKTFFNKNQEVKTAVQELRSKKLTKEGRDYVELNTTLTEEEVYNQQGLIKAQDNFWIKTAKQPLEELYPIMETYNPNIREEIQNQIAQLEGFNNAETAEAVMLYKNYFGVSSDVVSEGLKKQILEAKNINSFLRDIITDYDVRYKNRKDASYLVEIESISYIDSIKPEQNVEREMVEYWKERILNGESPFIIIRTNNTIDGHHKLQAYKETGKTNVPVLYEDRLIKAYNSVRPSIITNKVSNFTGNYEYLTTDFLKDFYAKMLKERNRNSATWKNFYNKFGINERGLFLNTEDLETIKDYADENLKQYSLISKQLPNLIETETEITNRRDEAINNPQTVNKFEGQIFSIPTGEIIIKDSVEEFVRIGEDVYENVDVQDNLSLYTKLPKNNSPYYKVGEKEIETDVKLSDYNYLQNKEDKFTTVKNYLTKEEKEKTNNEFNC